MAWEGAAVQVTIEQPLAAAVSSGHMWQVDGVPGALQQPLSRSQVDHSESQGLLVRRIEQQLQDCSAQAQRQGLLTC